MVYTIKILVEKLCEDHVSKEDRQLLNMIFSSRPSQEALDSLLEVWDIETKGSHKSLMLSYFMKERPEIKFGTYEGPRLQGLLNYYKFNNIKTLSRFAKAGKALNEAGVPVLIFKGGAMKFLRPELPRHMGDIDILVPSGRYEEAIGIASRFFPKISAEPHSADMTTEDGQCSIDVHRYILARSDDKDYERAERFNRALWSRAVRQKAFGVDALIPSNEDAVFIVLTNLVKNLTEKTSIAGILFSLTDCKYLMDSKPRFDANIVIEDARITDTGINVKLGMEFIDYIVPGLLPAELMNRFPFTPEMRDYFNRVTYDEFYFLDYRAICRAVRLKNIRTPRDICQYLALKPKYLIMKIIRNHPSLLPVFFWAVSRRESK
jgi:hypothetical protein